MTLTVQTCARCGKPFKKRYREMYITFVNRKYCGDKCRRAVSPWRKRICT